MVAGTVCCFPHFIFKWWHWNTTSSQSLSFHVPQTAQQKTENKKLCVPSPNLLTLHWRKYCDMPSIHDLGNWTSHYQQCSEAYETTQHCTNCNELSLYTVLYTGLHLTLVTVLYCKSNCTELSKNCTVLCCTALYWIYCAIFLMSVLYQREFISLKFVGPRHTCLHLQLGLL